MKKQPKTPAEIATLARELAAEIETATVSETIGLTPAAFGATRALEKLASEMEKAEKRRPGGMCMSDGLPQPEPEKK
jgi:hypothetical protein